LRHALVVKHPHLGALDRILPAETNAITRLAAKGGATDRAPFRPAVTDFYLTNAITRASAVMAECSALALGHLRVAAE
jgi:NADH-quinone oxidoreductase subunit G